MSMLRSLSGTALQRFFSLRDEVAVVAVHSEKTNLDDSFIENWYEAAIVWLTELGEAPRTLSFVGVTGFEDAVGYEFTAADKKLRSIGFSSLPYVSIASTSMPGIGSFKPRYSATLSNSHVEGVASVLSWGWETTRRHLSKNAFLTLADVAQSWGMLDYAFGFCDSARRHPEQEAMCSSFTDRSVVKRGRISHKSYSTKDLISSGGHPIRLLRNLYPFQMVSTSMLTYEVDGMNLRAWIESSSKNGRLEAFSPNSWLWEIASKDLAEVRSRLAENHLLTLYLPDKSRIFEDYAFGKLISPKVPFART